MARIGLETRPTATWPWIELKQLGLPVMMPTLNQLFDKVLEIPGVSEVLKPTIDALRAKPAVLTA